MRQEKNEDFLLKGLIRKIYGDKNITLKIFYSFTIWYGKVLSNNFYNCQYSHLNTLYRSFIRKKATLEDLEELERLINERKKSLTY